MKCQRCNGTGTVTTYSHSGTGPVEREESQCTACGGTGVLNARSNMGGWFRGLFQSGGVNRNGDSYAAGGNAIQHPSDLTFQISHGRRQQAERLEQLNEVRARMDNDTSLGQGYRMTFDRLVDEETEDLKKSAPGHEPLGKHPQIREILKRYEPPFAPEDRALKREWRELRKVAVERFLTDEELERVNYLAEVGRVRAEEAKARERARTHTTTGRRKRKINLRKGIE